jgi:hypothetical protein
LAHEIADNTSSVSTSLSRRPLWQMMTASHPMQTHLIETHALNVRGVSADAWEGISAFLDRRSPEFTDSVTAQSTDYFASWTEPEYLPPAGIDD